MNNILPVQYLDHKKENKKNFVTEICNFDVTTVSCEIYSLAW